MLCADTYSGLLGALFRGCFAKEGMTAATRAARRNFGATDGSQSNAPVASGDSQPETGATITVELGIDVARRCVFNPTDQSLEHVIKSGTGDAGLMLQLNNMRGNQLTHVCGIELTKDETYQTILEVIERSDDYGDSELLELRFLTPGWPPSATEEKRQKQNNLYPPVELVTELSKQTLIAHLQLRSSKPLHDLNKVPNNLRFYFNHPFWRLDSLGALLQMPPRSLKELDLSDSALHDVGSDLSRFESLVELKLNGNRLPSIELHYLPSLKHLNLAFNQLTILPELLGLPALEELDLSDNKIGSRESGEDLSSDQGESSDGWERLVHSPLTNLKSLLLANNELKWPQPAFNSRVAVMADKKALLKVEFRGNPMTFRPRLDDLPPLRRYREWILMQCKNLTELDGEPISEQERLRLLLDPQGGAEPESDEDGGDSDSDEVCAAPPLPLALPRARLGPSSFSAFAASTLLTPLASPEPPPGTYTQARFLAPPIPQRRAPPPH